MNTFTHDPLVPSDFKSSIPLSPLDAKTADFRAQTRQTIDSYFVRMADEHQIKVDPGKIEIATTSILDSVVSQFTGALVNYSNMSDYAARKELDMEALFDFYASVPDQINEYDLEGALGKFDDAQTEGHTLTCDEIRLRLTLVRMQEDGGYGVYILDSNLDEWLNDRLGDIPEWISDVIDWDDLYGRVRSQNPDTYDLEGHDYRLMTSVS